MMKPNLTELITIINYCLQHNLILQGRANVSSIIANIVASRINQKTLDSIHQIDISDIRILATALLRVLYGNQSKQIKKPSDSAASSSSPSLIQGKHLFISMGKRGMLWCCPARYLSLEDKTSLNKLLPNNSGGNVVISGDEAFPLMTAYIPVEIIQKQEIRYSANGAGDAFCAGVMFGILQSTGLLNQNASTVSSSKSKLSVTSYPNYSNIRMGLQNARNWILRK
jgi:hypothetical protein